jgi:hypothetical protein
MTRGPNVGSACEIRFSDHRVGILSGELQDNFLPHVGGSIASVVDDISDMARKLLPVF